MTQISSQGAFGNFASNNLSATQNNGNQHFEQVAHGVSGASNRVTATNNSSFRNSLAILQDTRTFNGHASSIAELGLNANTDETILQSTRSTNGSASASVAQVRIDPRSLVLGQDTRARTSAVNTAARTEIAVSSQSEQFASATHGGASNSLNVAGRSGGNAQMASVSALQGAIGTSASNAMAVRGAANFNGEQSSVATNGNASNVANLSNIGRGTFIQNAAATANASNTLTFTT